MGPTRLTFRDPSTFQETGDVRVTLRGLPLTGLNELECVGDVVYSNVYQDDAIVIIDPGSGRVTHTNRRVQSIDTRRSTRCGCAERDRI